MFINTTTLNKVTRQSIKKETGASIGKRPSDEALSHLGYANLTPVPRPQGDIVEEGNPELRQDGKWYQTWSVRPYTTEELEAKLSVERSKAMRRVDVGYQESVDRLVEEYPDSEVSTFIKQDAEARRWLADNTSPTPFIDTLLEERRKEDSGMSKAYLIDRIIDKSDAYTSSMGRLTGRRQALRERIERETLENVRRIEW